MRIISLAAGAVMILGTFGAHSAFAADWQSLTCAQFTAMDATTQADIAGQIKRSDVAKTESGSNGMSSDNSQTANVAGGNPPVKAGNVIAACQAATGTTTLADLVATPGALDITKSATTNK